MTFRRILALKTEVWRKVKSMKMRSRKPIEQWKNLFPEVTVLPQNLSTKKFKKMVDK